MGTRILPGRTLYRVDNLPVTLMAGDLPAWRPFTSGMTAGPDVAELQANLIALGDARGLFSGPSGRWIGQPSTRSSAGSYPRASRQTGEIPLGDVIFLPSAVRVGAENYSSGLAAAPGQLPYQVTKTSQTVTVPLTPNLPTVSIGEAVSVLLPFGATLPGRVTAIGPAVTTASPDSRAAAALTVTPDRPVAGASTSEVDVPVQASVTTQSVHNVLAVPIASLLALANGGYGLELVPPSGTHRLIGVRTGVFAGSEVQVSGAGVQVGSRVMVAQ